MYSLHCLEIGGFRASEGSWYFKTMAPAEVDTVFEAAARRPDGRQFGFCFSGVVSSVPLKASFCEGSGRLDLGLLDLLRGDRERDIV